MRTKLILALMLLSLIAVGAYAQDLDNIDIPELAFEIPDAEQFTLDNGIKVFFYEDHSLPVVALDLVFKTGEIRVPGEKAGLADLCGTVLRSGGTESVPADEFDQRLDFVGSSLSSTCETEMARISLRTLKEHVEECLYLTSLMLKEPVFAQDKLNVARENKIEEIRRENDDPHTIVRREFYRKVFPGHPYGSSATEATISSVTRLDLIDFYRSTYSPDQCVVALSGDLSRVNAEVMLKEYFEDWRPDEALPMEFAPVPAAEPGVFFVQKDMNQSYIRLGHQGIGRTNPERFAVEVMNHILGVGFTSRLTSKIRVEEGLAYSVGSNFYQMDSTGSFYAYCQTKGEKTGEAISLMISEIRRFIADGATTEELESAKSSIINSDVFNYATPHQVAIAGAMLDFNGMPPDGAERRIERIKAVTLADVSRVARRYINPDQFIIIVVGNEELLEGSLEEFGTVSRIEL